MKNNSIPTIVITDLSTRIENIQWFLYGLMLLDRKKEIILKFKIPFAQRFFYLRNSNYPIRIKNKLFRLFHLQKFDKTKSYLRGYISNQKITRSFCIDSTDSPNMFNGELLRTVDCYFKLQCPKEINQHGFKLGNIFLPYFDSELENKEDYGKIKGRRKICPEVFQFQHKIKPLMIAVRSMGMVCGFKLMNNTYQNLLKARSVEQTEKAMCYFGNSKGPIPTENVLYPDYDYESDILGYYGNKLNHPNEKRAKIAKYIESLGAGYDARIISNGYADDNNSIRNQNLIIPLKDFTAHVARFQYNINISGYRMSIPARFIDSFICGTTIATDNLSVKWYHPFGNEVIELGEMGYLTEDQVDYKSINSKLSSLPPTNRKEIIDIYEKYWAPEPVAKFMIETTLNS